MFTCFELAAVIAAERDYVQLIFNLNILREIIRAANDPSVFTITKKAPTNISVLNNIVLNVKVLVGGIKQEKALVWAFSMIVKSNGSFAALEII